MLHVACCTLYTLHADPTIPGFIGARNSAHADARKQNTERTPSAQLSSCRWIAATRMSQINEAGVHELQCADPMGDTMRSLCVFFLNKTAAMWQAQARSHSAQIACLSEPAQWRYVTSASPSTFANMPPSSACRRH